MRNYQASWPQIANEFNDSLSRRADELYEIEDAILDDEGLIECAILPLRDVVLFPSMLTPLFVVHEPTLLAIEEAISRGETMLAVAQRDGTNEEPSIQDLYHVGTEVAVGRIMRLPERSISVLTQGRRRVEIVEITQTQPYMRAKARPVPESMREDDETVALMRAVLTLFEKCVQLNRSLPEEAYLYAVNIEEPGWLGDLVASSLNISVEERQQILESYDPVERLHRVSILLGRELDLLEIEDKIHSHVQNEVDRSQREAYLREQLKAIQTELGEGDVWAEELSEMREMINHLTLPDEVLERAMREMNRLSQMPSMAPEAGVIRGYMEWLLALPWANATDDNLDVANASQVLERDHHSLKKAKERVLEYIAVRSLVPTRQKQPILCFVGPPGTGKTSIGRSIAEALGREFIRLSLGGVRDEAEIRGHRRTYIGALPGRILQAMRRAGSINPLFMLDEIDKLGHDFRGDPSAALLEVLDPEQNHAFSDHYLELAYDLSHVMFITTANSLDPIPDALLDRMEVIEFPGYIEEDKIIIAKRFLIPRQLEQNGLVPDDVQITEPVLQAIIRTYTWEAGVRNLEREIGKVLRKTARKKAEGKKHPRRITVGMLADLLGPPEIIPHKPEQEDQIGMATGLVWTKNGGETMPVEVLVVDGKGNLQITGQIGEVMQESAQAALTYIKSRSAWLKIEPDIFDKTDIHIHVPEGAIPKDGPSGGITMATALASALTKRPVFHTLGMTGEITLLGRVLPVGGLREKILAAYRLGLRDVILPAENEKNLVELPKKARSALGMHFVSNMDEVLDLALQPAKSPKRSRKSSKKT